MDYYSILGVEKTATEDEIKKAYKKLAIKNHPDKAPPDKVEEYTKEFQKITEANEVLTNPEKRKLYDEHGVEGLRHPNSHPMNDIFSMFGMRFNFGQPFQPPQPSKNADTVFNLTINLKEVLLGTTRKIKITKNAIKRISDDVIIKENVEQTWTKCKVCSGNGRTVKMYQQGNMFQQVHQHCDSCKGTGASLLPEYISTEIAETIILNIEKGSQQGQQIRYQNQGNCSPGTLPGDIIAIINIEPTLNGYTLDGNNLLYKQPISLYEALCGGSFTIQTIDDKTLSITFKGVKIGDTISIKDCGINGGNLIISFDILFPTLSDEQKNALQKILNQPTT